MPDTKFSQFSANASPVDADEFVGLSSGANKRATLSAIMGAGLTALRALTPAADKFGYWTSGSAAALADLTTQGRDILALTTPDGLRALMNLNDWRLLPTSKTANYTAAAGDLVLCDATAGSFTVTLPGSTPGIMPPRIAIKLTATSGTNKVTIARPSGGTINGAAADIDLFMAGDYLWLTNTAASAWHVVAERLQPHCAIVETAASQSVVTNTWVTIPVDTTVQDSCALADLANDRITVRRAGKYLATAYGWLDLGGSGIPGGAAISLNGSTYDRANTQDNAGNNYNGHTTKLMTLAAGDYLQLRLYQGSGGTRNTNTTATLRPSLSLQEVR